MLLVYYCNEVCMQKSLEGGHHLECPIIFFIRSMPGITKLNELALKWLLKDISKIGLKKYCSLVDGFSKSQTDPMTRGFNENGLYKSDNFLTAYSLDSSENKLSMDVLFFFNCIAAEMLEYLMLSGFKIQNCHLGTVGNSLVHILSVLDLNCRKLNINGPTGTYLCGGIITYPFHITFPLALALYPSISLFNHSCNPNISRSGKLSDRIRVMKAIQPIPKGSQLFFSYGERFDEMDKKERQDICRDNFKFECFCQCCLEDWPPYCSTPDIPSARNILNPSMADIVIQECKVFEQFMKIVDPHEYHLHLN